MRQRTQAEANQRIADVARISGADRLNVMKLIEIAGLDPASDFRFENWSGVSFAGLDLTGFDFTGARLHGCDFDGATLSNARFDQAELGRVLHRPGRDPHAPAETTAITRVTQAADWDAFSNPRRWERLRSSVGDAHLPVGAIFQDAPFGPQMIVVPAGDFRMGEADKEQTQAHIPLPFAIGRFAVTFAEWDAAQAHPDWREFSGIPPREAKDNGWGRGNQPAIDVSWDDARAYCAWLSAVTGKAYRLPTEAEWEYCCRAGTSTEFWWGNEISTEQANYEGSVRVGLTGTRTRADPYDFHTPPGGIRRPLARAILRPSRATRRGEYRNRTVPFNSFEPNPWGLYQVHGKVWEWCEDIHEGEASLRVLRGGSWSSGPRYLRSAARFWIRPVDRVSDVGFRVARTLSPPSP